MREILDVVEIDQLNKCFADIFYELQRGELQRSGVLKDYILFYGQYLLAPPQYLLATDGTGYFSSSNIHCPSCLEKKSKTGKLRYSHQMVVFCLSWTLSIASLLIVKAVWTEGCFSRMEFIALRQKRSPGVAGVSSVAPAYKLFEPSAQVDKVQGVQLRFWLPAINSIKKYCL